MKKKILGVVAVATVTALAVLSAAAVMKPSEVVYAESVDYGAFMQKDGTDKVTCLSEFAQYAENDSLRIMVMFYDTEKAYQDIYSQKIDGYTLEEIVKIAESGEDEDKTSDNWQKALELGEKIEKDVTAAETEWLASIGGSDIEEKGGHILECTIKRGDIVKFNDGKCTYRLILASKDENGLESYMTTAADSAEISQEAADYYGTYTCTGIAFVPLVSSYAVPEEDVCGGELTFNAEQLTFTYAGTEYVLEGEDVESLTEEKSFTIDKPSYTADTENDTLDKYYGFSQLDFAQVPSEILEIMSGSHASFKVKGEGGNCRIIVGGDTLYLDLGMQGVYSFH